MSLYRKHILPGLLDRSCGKKNLEHERLKIIPKAYGSVLEVGVGSGYNFPFYDSCKVDHFVGIDTCDEMLCRANLKADRLLFPVELQLLDCENLPFGTDSIDTVVSTFSLCTFSNISAALREIHRVLKPTGQFLFCEHGKAPHRNVQIWQDVLNPLSRKLVGGCNLNRNIPKLLKEEGFAAEITEWYMPDTPKFSGYSFLGEATLV